MKKYNIKSFVTIGMLSSVAFVLMLIKFPIPPFPPYLTVDFSDIPALIAAFMFGPAAAILVELFKNIIDYIVIGSEAGIPIGNFSNFIAGIVFVIPTYFVYRRLQAKHGLVVSLVVGTLFMAIFMSILNYIAILPAYIALLGWDPMTTSALRQLVVAAVLPFNIIKGIIVAVVFLLLYSRMGKWLHENTRLKNA